MVWADGTASSISRFSTCALTLLWTSTTGDSPETVTVSSTVPTFRSALMVEVKFEGSSMASFLMIENPTRLNVIV